MVKWNREIEEKKTRKKRRDRRDRSGREDKTETEEERQEIRRSKEEDWEGLSKQDSTKASIASRGTHMETG